jgi:Ca2+-binding EF-hand superfamily protein
LIIEALKIANIKMSDAFELIDKEKKGTISRDDFKDIFKSLRLNAKI